MEAADLIGLLLATILGAIVGLERELSGKAAGLRTNVLICLGAAAFTIIARRFTAFTDDSSARIMAQIITGVGFIGAGAIIQDRGGVFGLTTAATIWLVAAIGMACGTGFYLFATLISILAIIVLVGLSKFDTIIKAFKTKGKHPKDDDV